MSGLHPETSRDIERRRRESMHFESLPFAGARLISLRFCGNGKDSEVTLEAEGHRKITLPLENAGVELCISGAIAINTRGWGDTEVIWEIEPTPKEYVRLEEVAIGFSNTTDQCEESLQLYRRTGTLITAVALRVRLSAMVSPSSDPSTAG